MKDGYDASIYGERISSKYDEWYGSCEKSVIDLICEYADGGTIFELGIGTGRIAIPLVERGLSVAGIDASRAMVEQMKKKSGSESIRVQIGDFSCFSADKHYDMAFVAFNTFFLLPDQEQQINCFRSVHKLLSSEGRFLIEAFVPDLKRFDKDQTVRTVDLSDGSVKLECSQHDAVQQVVTSQIVNISENGVKLYPVKVRYAWPSEIDLMARLTGFELLERWGGWKKEPFSKNSGFHVSLYQRSK